MGSFKPKYTASMTFNEKTVQQAFKIEYFTYDKLKVIIRAVIGFLIIAVAILAHFPTAVTVILLLIGCWLFVALDFPSKVKAEGVIQARKGAVNTVHLLFGELFVELKEENKQYKYTDIDRLIAEKEYLVIFFSRQSAVMLDTNTLKPANVSEFRSFISEKSGKTWKTTSMLFMNFNELKQAVKDFRNK